MIDVLHYVMENGVFLVVDNLPHDGGYQSCCISDPDSSRCRRFLQQL